MSSLSAFLLRTPSKSTNLFASLSSCPTWIPPAISLNACALLPHNVLFQSLPSKPPTFVQPITPSPPYAGSLRAAEPTSASPNTQLLEASHCAKSQTLKALSIPPPTCPRLHPSYFCFYYLRESSLLFLGPIFSYPSRTLFFQ